MVDGVCAVWMICRDHAPILVNDQRDGVKQVRWTRFEASRAPLAGSQQITCSACASLGAMPSQSEADRAPVLDNFADYLISAGTWFEYTVVGRRRGGLNQSDPEIVNSSSGHIVSIASG